MSYAGICGEPELRDCLSEREKIPVPFQVVKNAAHIYTLVSFVNSLQSLARIGQRRVVFLCHDFAEPLFLRSFVP